ncbi:MAG: helix-turn-helix domain-containing protein [Clostridium perfringens]|nr:helix-turn-helix domain-containing protein [Clostridium perfringens]
MQFLKLPYELITDKEITANEFRIYTYLLSLYNSEKNCSYPSLEVISDKLGICLTTVKKSIKRLAELKYITIEKRKGLAGNFNIYKDLKHLKSIEDKDKSTKNATKHSKIVKKLKNKISNKVKKVNDKNMENNDINNIDAAKNTKNNIEYSNGNKNHIDSHINVRLARSVTNVDNSSFAKKILSLANENIVREAIKTFKKKRGKTPTFLISLMIDEYCRRGSDFPRGMFNLLKGNLNNIPILYL